MYLALANFLIIMKGMKWLFELPYFSVLSNAPHWLLVLIVGLV